MEKRILHALYTPTEEQAKAGMKPVYVNVFDVKKGVASYGLTAKDQGEKAEVSDQEKPGTIKIVYEN